LTSGTVTSILILLLLLTLAIILAMSYQDTDALLTSREVKLPFNLSVGAAIAFGAIVLVLFLLLRKRRG
jgi:uncharacterized membrane protein (DUF4010 family)